MKSIVNIKCDIIKKWTIRLLITLGCVLPIFLGCLYFFQFNGVLSPNQNDWVAFGSYIGGVAAITNVGVFVWLTLAIKYDGDKEREKERNHQRQIIITLFRKSEIEKLQRLVSVILEQKGKERFNAIVTLKYTLLYLETSENPLLTERNYKLSEEVPFDYNKIIANLEKIEDYHFGRNDSLYIAPYFSSFSIQMDTFINGLQRKLLRDLSKDMDSKL